MQRDIKEIISDAHHATKLETLVELWNEIANHNREYTLTDILSANTHIRNLALKLKDDKDIEIGKFYYHLINQIPKHSTLSHEQ